MDVVCGLTAFQLYRMPPLVMGIYPRIPTLEEDRHRKRLFRHPLISDALSLPLHILVNNTCKRAGSKRIKQHFFQRALPEANPHRLPLDILITSPLATLLSMAKNMSTLQLAMAMYELCGTFSVFEPRPNIIHALDAAIPNWRTLSYDGWRLVPNQPLNKPSLWQRPPLVTLSDLAAYTKKAQGFYGGSNFAKAAACVNGVVASPFEAELTMLLTLPKHMGGEAINGFFNNQRITLTHNAKTLARKEYCLVDLYHEGVVGNAPLAIECQGKLVHDDRNSGIADADRSLGLKEMGIEVLELSYKQIADETSWHIVLNQIRRQLGLKQKRPTEAERKRTEALRYEIFRNWAELGC